MKKLVKMASLVLLVILTSGNLQASNSYWKLDETLRENQCNTGKHWATNCTPTTLYHVVKYTGSDFKGSIGRIRRIMIPEYDYVGRGVYYSEMLKFPEYVNIPYTKVSYKYKDKEECKKYIVETLETSVIVNQLNLQFNPIYGFEQASGHCLLLVGSFEEKGKLYLYTIDPSLSYTVWDFDTWWDCYKGWGAKGENYLTSFTVKPDNCTKLEFVDYNENLAITDSQVYKPSTIKDY